MTNTQRSDASTLKERQYYFIKEHLKILPSYFFISQLNAPLNDTNSMTLRRALMAKAPVNKPTSRLIHNIDASWNQPSKHTVTTVVGREAKAQRFLVNMIPELLHRFGDDATKWFTGAGLLVYKDVKWNPVKGTTSSLKERDSEAMVKEDLWDLNEQWEKIAVTPKTDSKRPDAIALDTTTATPPDTTSDTVGLASDKSIASFGNVYQRPRDADDALADDAQAKADSLKVPDLSGAQFVFNTDQLARDRQKVLDGPLSTGFSMSTAAKTTPSIRLKYKEAEFCYCRKSQGPLFSSTEPT
jgi:hypothetical protein